MTKNKFLTRKETASRLGISERTLRRKYKHVSSFDTKWVHHMEKVYDLKKKLTNAIKSTKLARLSLRQLIFNKKP